VIKTIVLVQGYVEDVDCCAITLKHEVGFKTKEEAILSLIGWLSSFGVDESVFIRKMRQKNIEWITDWLQDQKANYQHLFENPEWEVGYLQDYPLVLIYRAEQLFDHPDEILSQVCYTSSDGGM
jgi:hypothetical protein